MKKYIIVCLVIISFASQAQNEFRKFIDYVNVLGTPALKQAAVDSFVTYARTKGIPFITGDSANFLYRGNVNSALISGDFNMWSSSTSMVNVSQTNFWYYSRKFEPNARMDYKFITNGNNWILDPENPNTIPSGFGPNSELAMPQYIQPAEIKYNQQISHGTVLEKYLFSAIVGSGYQLKIYLPPGYDSTSANKYPTVYYQDGYEYVSLAMAVNVLDNLINENKIEKVIAVFVKPNNRNEEYAGTTRVKYRNFFVNELVPYIDSLYRTYTTASKRLVLGDSYGGNISALISYNNPNIFGNCGLHSGAFQPNNYEIFAQIMNDLGQGIKKEIKWCSVYGSYEGELTGAMTAFADSMARHGYVFKSRMLPEGHSWGLWRANTDYILEYFFPGSSSGINENNVLPDKFILEQNYPNPFNPQTTIKFTLSEKMNVLLKVYDILGKEVAMLFNGEMESGTHSINFNAASFSSGVYFYRIDAGEHTATRKMQLLK